MRCTEGSDCILALRAGTLPLLLIHRALLRRLLERAAGLRQVGGSAACLSERQLVDKANMFDCKRLSRACFAGALELAYASTQLLELE